MLRGQASGNQKDLCGLIRGLDHSFQHLKAVSDGLALSMAQVGAAFSKPPVDSAGQSRALDLLLQLGESFRDCEGIWQELKESSRDTLTRTQELGTTMTELRVVSRRAMGCKALVSKEVHPACPPSSIYRVAFPSEARALR